MDVRAKRKATYSRCTALGDYYIIGNRGLLEVRRQCQLPHRPAKH